MRISVTTTCGLKVVLHDRDAKELVRALNRQRPVHQQDTLTLVAVERGVTRNVDDREVAAARTGRISPVTPLQQTGLITAGRATEVRVALICARRSPNRPARCQLRVGRRAT